MIYLAAPYTHASPVIRAERSRKVGKAMAALAAQDFHVIAPTFLGHELESKFKLDLPYAYWLSWSRALLVRCSEMYVLPLEGWRTSIGLESECRLAVSLKIPITGFGGTGTEEEEVSGLDIRKHFGLDLAVPKSLRRIE